MQVANKTTVKASEVGEKKGRGSNVSVLYPQSKLKGDVNTDTLL